MAEKKTMAELWPMRLSRSKNGFWVKLRDRTVGPYSTRQEAIDDVGEMQNIALGLSETNKEEENK